MESTLLENLIEFVCRSFKHQFEFSIRFVSAFALRILDLRECLKTLSLKFSGFFENSSKSSSKIRFDTSRSSLRWLSSRESRLMVCSMWLLDYLEFLSSEIYPLYWSPVAFGFVAGNRGRRPDLLADLFYPIRRRSWQIASQLILID